MSHFIRFHRFGVTALLLVLAHVGAAQGTSQLLTPHATGADSPRASDIMSITSAPTGSAALPTTADSARPWLTSRERWTAAGFIAATLVALPFDGAMARGFERPSVHRDARLARSASVVRWLGDPGAVALTVGSYAVGRVGGHEGLADAGLHATEAVLVSGATTNLLKLAIGRARPHVVGGRDAFAFRPGRGLSGFASFPSGHTTAAFAAASAVSAELRRSSFADRHPRFLQAAPVALFGMATLVGVSRMYHDAHWASDVLAGAGIGTVAGHVLVRRQHSRSTRSRLDRLLLGMSVEGADGGVLVRFAYPER
jgi:membrane-associated phospholipid phosphatase